MFDNIAEEIKIYFLNNVALLTTVKTDARNSDIYVHVDVCISSDSCTVICYRHLAYVDK